jgi:transposase
LERDLCDRHRVQFTCDYLTGDFSKREMYKAYEISRSLGDRLIKRYTYEGVEVLNERSRAPYR